MPILSDIWQMCIIRVCSTECAGRALVANDGHNIKFSCTLFEIEPPYRSMAVQSVKGWANNQAYPVSLNVWAQTMTITYLWGLKTLISLMELVEAHANRQSEQEVKKVLKILDAHFQGGLRPHAHTF